MKKNTQAFSLVIAMWIVILITLLAFLILEYIIPFGRNVKGLENSSKAYYQSQTAVEQALLFRSLSSTTTWDSNTIAYAPSSPIAYSYDIAGNGRILPPVWEWNSEYDTDWNIIAPGQPIQLEIGELGINAIDWWNASFSFRVPNIDELTASTPNIWWGTGAIINWQIWSTTDLLSASGSWITADEINNTTPTGILIGNRNGATLESWDINVADFYTSNTCATLQCTLKFSIVNPLLTQPNPSFDSVKLPYLEWRFSFADPIPLRYADIKSSGKSYGFKKNINIKIPQQTIVEAFDFTVFQ